MNKEMILKNWGLIGDLDLDYHTICGDIYGSVRFRDGHFVQTTVVKKFELVDFELVATTKSGSRYLLEKNQVSEFYQKSVPNWYEEIISKWVK